MTAVIISALIRSDNPSVLARVVVLQPEVHRAGVQRSHSWKILTTGSVRYALYGTGLIDPAFVVGAVAAEFIILTLFEDGNARLPDNPRT